MNDASELPWLASANAAEAWACCKKQDAFSKAPLSKFRLSASQLQLLQTQAEFATGPAKRKVAKPWNWFWTKTLLEQASDEWTAEETAKDFPSDAQVVDGCCGAGVDSIKIAEHLSQSGDFKNRITAIDSSQIACQLTRLNSLSNGFALSPPACDGPYGQCLCNRPELACDFWTHLQRAGSIDQGGSWLPTGRRFPLGHMRSTRNATLDFSRWFSSAATVVLEDSSLGKRQADCFCISQRARLVPRGLHRGDLPQP